MSEGDAPEDAIQEEFSYELDIPGSVTSCRASQLGLRPGDYDNPRYREAYERVMIVREPDDAADDDDDESTILVSVAHGTMTRALLMTYIVKYDGKGLERKFMLEHDDSRIVLQVTSQRSQQMQRLGFDVKRYDKKRVNRGGP